MSQGLQRRGPDSAEVWDARVAIVQGRQRPQEPAGGALSGDQWGSVPEAYKAPTAARSVAQRNRDVLIARHAQSLAGESALRGGDHYRAGYKGKRDPMAHFYGPQFHADKASDDLKDWWQTSGQKSIRHADFNPERSNG